MPNRRFATLCGLLAALATAAQAYDVLTITNASKQTWTLNPSHLGEAPVMLALANGAPKVYKGDVITLQPAQSATFTYLPWGGAMPPKYRALEATPGRFARHHTFDVIDSKGVPCCLAHLWVDTRTEKANINLALNWVKTWAVPGQLRVLSQDTGPELRIETDFAQIKGAAAPVADAKAAAQ